MFLIEEKMGQFLFGLRFALLANCMILFALWSLFHGRVMQLDRSQGRGRFALCVMKNYRSNCTFRFVVCWVVFAYLALFGSMNEENNNITLFFMLHIIYNSLLIKLYLKIYWAVKRKFDYYWFVRLKICNSSMFACFEKKTALHFIKKTLIWVFLISFKGNRFFK